jgi:hypothetical protein
MRNQNPRITAGGTTSQILALLVELIDSIENTSLRLLMISNPETIVRLIYALFPTYLYLFSLILVGSHMRTTQIGFAKFLEAFQVSPKKFSMSFRMCFGSSLFVAVSVITGPFMW